MNKIEIVSEERDYDGYLKIDKAIVKDTDESGNETTYSRFKLTRPDAVAILVYNIDEDSVVLVKQHRYPIADKVTGEIFEIVAGKVDEGEDPRDAALREVKEEIGYDINTEEMLYMSSYFPSPGYSSETIHLYVARVHNENKTSAGGGVEGEHESLDIHSIPARDFFNMIARGEIVDGKTITGANAFWHLRNDHFVQLGQQYKKILDEQKKEGQQ